MINLKMYYYLMIQDGLIKYYNNKNGKLKKIFLINLSKKHKIKILLIEILHIILHLLKDY
jgi:hypothetical protein